MKRKTIETALQQTAGELPIKCSGELLNDPLCVSLLGKVLETLNDIKVLFSEGNNQISELHRLIITLPKEKVIPITLKELRDEHIRLDLMIKSKK